MQVFSITDTAGLHGKTNLGTIARVNNPSSLPRLPPASTIGLKPTATPASLIAV
jgi:hypothetical protein